MTPGAQRIVRTDMDVIKTDIDGLVLLSPVVFEDSRGYFFESFNARDFEALTGQKVCFVQDNESRSSRRTVRGLHFQKGESAQAKLVSVVRGRVWDVAVDIRPGSPTFGKYAAYELSASNRLRLFIPKGFAHGFAVLEDDTVFQYKCDAYYDPSAEDGIAWDDPALGIPWPFSRGEAILSEKDRNRRPLSQIKDF